MKKIKRDIPFLLWFIIVTRLAYSGLIISIDEKNWLINLCQGLSPGLIIFQSYFLIEMLIRKKVNLKVLNGIQHRKSIKYKRVFFLARVNDQQERILSIVDPMAWLLDVIKTIETHFKDQLVDLLPHRWKKRMKNDKPPS